MTVPVEALRQQIQDMIKQQQDIFQKQLELQQQLQQLELQQQQQPQLSVTQDVLETKDELSSPGNKTEEMKVDSPNLGLPPAYDQLDNRQQSQHSHQLAPHHPPHIPPLQKPFVSQQTANSCSYYMRLRHMGEHPEGMYTTYSPEWYIGNLGFRASLWPDNYGKSYCAALHLSYFSVDTTAPASRATVRCKVTLMDPMGRQQDCLLAEREAVFDGSRQVVDEWARGCVMVRIKMKDIKERGMCSDYTLLIRYDVSISV